MSAPGPKDQLLRPLLESLPQHSRKSNSSVESRSSYFSSVGSRAAPPRKDSPFEGPIVPSHLSAGVASPSCASDYASDYSVESQYLSPPQSRGDNEKPPYKARSSRAASLDMTADQSGHSIHKKHKHRAKKRHLKHESGSHPENNTKRKEKSQEQGCSGCKEGGSLYAESGEGYEELGMISRSIKGLKNTVESLGDVPSRSSKLMSMAADNIITRRWSSVGIIAQETLPKHSNTPDHKRNSQAMNGIKRSDSWDRDTNNDEILKIVRARLTFREVPTNHLPTPATITLRRASGIPIDHNRASSTNCDLDPSSCLLTQTDQGNEVRPTTSTYLITTDDVNFITSLIQSGIDVKKTTVKVPDHNNIAPRKSSVTSQGVLPLSSLPIGLAAMTADMHQTAELPRTALKDSKNSDLKETMWSIRKLSRAFSSKVVPEIIWKGTGSTGSRNTLSKASSSSEEQDEALGNSSAAWLLGQSFSVTPQVGPTGADPSGDHQNQGNDDEDNSPTSRVFQWVFKESPEEMVRAQGIFEKQTAPDETLESPNELGKGKCSPTVSLFTPDVVSFPPLPPRTFTSDWISPLPDMIAPIADHGKSLYGAGIDAQVGSGTKEPIASLIHLGEHDDTTRVANQQRESQGPDSEFQVRRKSANLLHPQVTPRLGDPFKVGNALGCSSGARRKSSTQAVRLRINDEAMEHHFHPDQTAWVKPRKDSGWPAPKSPSPEELDSRRPSRTLLSPVIQAQGQAGKGVAKYGDRFDLIKDLMPLLPEADHSGIYAALTGTQAAKMNCEPNCQRKYACGKSPHGSRNPSTDWIG